MSLGLRPSHGNQVTRPDLRRVPAEDPLSEGSTPSATATQAVAPVPHRSLRGHSPSRLRFLLLIVRGPPEYCGVELAAAPSILSEDAPAPHSARRLRPAAPSICPAPSSGRSSSACESSLVDPRAYTRGAPLCGEFGKIATRGASTGSMVPYRRLAASGRHAVMFHMRVPPRRRCYWSSL